MSSTSIEFPLQRRLTPFGPVIEPQVLLEVRTTAGYRGQRFLIDTGADVSVVPRRIADQVGYTWDQLPEVLAVGIGPGTVTAKFASVQLRFGSIEIPVRCLFLDQGTAPFILGRLDVLDRFALTIDARQGKVILTDLR